MESITQFEFDVYCGFVDDVLRKQGALPLNEEEHDVIRSLMEVETHYSDCALAIIKLRDQLN